MSRFFYITDQFPNFTAFCWRIFQLLTGSPVESVGSLGIDWTQRQVFCSASARSSVSQQGTSFQHPTVPRVEGGRLEAILCGFFLSALMVTGEEKESKSKWSCSWVTLVVSFKICRLSLHEFLTTLQWFRWLKFICSKKGDPKNGNMWQHSTSARCFIRGRRSLESLKTPKGRKMPIRVYCATLKVTHHW